MYAKMQLEPIEFDVEVDDMISSTHYAQTTWKAGMFFVCRSLF